MYLDDRSHAELQAYVSQKMYGLPNTMDIQATMELKCQEKQARSPHAAFRSSRALSNFTQNFGAMNSLYVGNNKADNFTSQWTNVWLTPHEFMYHDTGFASEVKRKEREETTFLYNLERQRLKERRIQEKLAKEALCQFYAENYGSK